MLDADSSVDAGLTSTSLLELVKASDEDGWCRLTTLYGPLIYSWCRKAGLGPEDSADILQDVFRSVVAHVTAFDHSQSTNTFRGWLWVITRNKIRDHFKTSVGKARAIGGSDAHVLLMQHAEQFIDQAESGHSLQDGLEIHVLKVIKAEVKESTWTAFWRTTIDGISPAAVADELQISIHSVWQARSRVLRRARQLLEA